MFAISTDPNLIAVAGARYEITVEADDDYGQPSANTFYLCDAHAKQVREDDRQTIFGDRKVDAPVILCHLCPEAEDIPRDHFIDSHGAIVFGRQLRRGRCDNCQSDTIVELHPGYPGQEPDHYWCVGPCQIPDNLPF